MNFKKLKYCPCTLSTGFNEFSPTALKKLFNGKKVSYILPFPSPHNSAETRKHFSENRNRISISGVQEKLSLVLEKNVLRLTKAGEQGEYILKVVPHDLNHVESLPANEHLTMQIAAQLFKIKTAENALVFFNDGEPAYLTKRFDRDTQGNKILQEDFASLAQKTAENAGESYKYSGSYEDVATLIRANIGAATTELLKFYKVVLFNYLFSNGDAHLKNFSILETSDGDSILSPMYDLLCTRLHVDDTYFALQDALFSNNYETESMKINGYAAYDDFFQFGKKLQLPESKIRSVLHEFISSEKKVSEMVKRSFLSKELQKKYLAYFQERLKAVRYSLERSNSKI